LRISAYYCNVEIAYTLAKIQWPRGVVDMPDDLHEYLPVIYLGAVIASGMKEFEAMAKCWIKGAPVNNAADIHHPSRDTYSRDLVRIDKYNAPRIIMQYAGYRDVVNETEHENSIDYSMNTSLYSSSLHKTFQAAYEKGQKESQKENKEKAGYGEGAMVVHKPAKPKSSFM